MAIEDFRNIRFTAEISVDGGIKFEEMAFGIMVDTADYDEPRDAAIEHILLKVRGATDFPADKFVCIPRTIKVWDVSTPSDLGMN